GLGERALPQPARVPLRRALLPRQAHPAGPATLGADGPDRPPPAARDGHAGRRRGALPGGGAAHLRVGGRAAKGRGGARPRDLRRHPEFHRRPTRRAGERNAGV
ncbi:MAG: FIG00801795: hypothetical protein, partial [uncultured Acetobacteraceae bacterium]